MSKIRQCQLRSKEGHEILVTWLEVGPKLKVGADISLKDFSDPTKRWIVEHIYDPEAEAHEFDWHRKWTNNI